MPGNLSSQILVIPLALFLSHAVLAAIVILRRGLRGREAGLFVGYLAVAAGWFLSFAQSGLRALWPVFPWERLAGYVLIGLGVVFWGFARAFLQKRPLPLWGLLMAGVVAAALVVLRAGLVTVPSMSLTVGTVTFTEEMVVPLLRVAVPVLYGVIAVVTMLVEYIRRPSPLHRNRIMYWLLGAVALVAGMTLAFVMRREVLEIAGAGVHLLGGMLLTYVVVRPDLPNIGIGVRRALGYLLTALLTVVVTVGLSMGIVYFLHQSPLFCVQFTESVFFSMIIAGAIVFLLYQPVSSLTRRVANRLLFGRGHEAQAVVREYSQAVTRILSLEPLVATAMEIIDGALGIRRGTLLVVGEKRETGWWLRVIEGLSVSADQPQLILGTDTPLVEWLVERGDPLHQYTLDVDPHFEVLSDAERDAWRQLNMEVFFPVRRSGDLIGLLAVGLRRSGRPYTSSDLNLLATLADQTAVALENASLFDRVQRRAEQLALLNEIGRAVTSSLNLESAVNLIAERIESAFKGTTGFIFLLEESQGDLGLWRAFGQYVPDVDSFRVRFGQGLVGSVALSGKPEMLSDLPGDSRYALEVEGALVSDAQAALCVPLVGQLRTLGVILVVAPSGTGLGPTELNLLDSIAAFASIAIENARQVEALQIEIDEIKRVQHVKEITDTDYFRDLQSQARQMREERASREQKGVFGHIQQKLEERAGIEDDELASGQDESLEADVSAAGTESDPP
jgi:GAF domain-containing protein